MTLYYPLIDEKDPKCLYCDSTCFCDSRDTYSKIYKCNSCREYWIYYYNSYFSLNSVGFSCENFMISHFLLSKEFYSVRSYFPEIESTEIPVFKINFSDKQKLLQQIKMSLVFL